MKLAGKCGYLAGGDLQREGRRGVGALQGDFVRAGGEACDLEGAAHHWAAVHSIHLNRALGKIGGDGQVGAQRL